MPSTKSSRRPGAGELRQLASDIFAALTQGTDLPKSVDGLSGKQIVEVMDLVAKRADLGDVSQRRTCSAEILSSFLDIDRYKPKPPVIPDLYGSAVTLATKL